MLEARKRSTLTPLDLSKISLGRFFDLPRPPQDPPERASLSSGSPLGPRRRPRSSQGLLGKLPGTPRELLGWGVLDSVPRCFSRTPSRGSKDPPRIPPGAPGTLKSVEMGVQTCFFNTKILNTLATRSPWGRLRPPPTHPLNRCSRLLASYKKLEHPRTSVLQAWGFRLPQKLRGGGTCAAAYLDIL